MSSFDERREKNMAIRVRRRAEARWKGSVPTGAGHIRTGSGALDSDYSLRSREMREKAGLVW